MPDRPRPSLTLASIGVLLLCVAAHAVAQSVAPPRATLDAGVVQGINVPGHPDEAAFEGIPFAAPPIGQRRWKPPAPVPHWRGIRLATRLAPVCPQRFPSPEYFDGIAERVGGRSRHHAPLKTSEDCLYLDVWSNNLHGSTRLPVMVWIHGGGNVQGWATQGTDGGAALARRGVVVVMIEYRLGALGFLADSALSAESPHHSSGNYGLLDQIAALHWVQRNIAAFGGDPGRVTIFGQSSGALDVTCLTMSPLAAGLFQRAISESGACTGPFSDLRTPVLSFSPHPAAELTGARLARDLGVANTRDVLGAMRAKSADAILAAAAADPHLSLDVIVDGWVMPEQPDLMMAAGRQQHIPLLIGSNADEYRTLARTFPVKTLARYPHELLDAFGSSAPLRRFLPQLLARYPAHDTAQAQQQLFAVNTDGFGYSARFTARAMRRAGERNVYLYRFTHVIPTPGGVRLGAFHTAEMPFVFGSNPGWPRGPGDAALADAIVGYWVRFAATGNPNRPGLPTWPAYEARTDPVLELGDQLRVVTGVRRAQYDLFDEAQRTLDALLAR